MEICIKEKYRSIDKIDDLKLPQFTVITGKNGSGKTHFLEALASRQHSQIALNGKQIINIQYLQFGKLIPQLDEKSQITQLTALINQAYDEFIRIKELNKGKQKLTLDDINRSLKRNQNFSLTLPDICMKATKPLNELSSQDFHNLYDPTLANRTENYLFGKLSAIFMNYYKKQHENKFHKYLNEKEGTSYEIFTDDEFNRHYGRPPWEIINEILDEIDLSYNVNCPADNERYDESFTLKFIDKTLDFEVKYTDFSTGEKCLLSLVIAMYNTTDFNKKVDLLLIDEPDAALHPTMSKKMIQIINDKIVNECNIPTIITTHSPMTVFVSPNESLYSMERGASRPTIVTKNIAVSILTEHMPFIKISDENRRQIFVESNNDVQYYEKLRNVLIDESILKIDPKFVCVSRQKETGEHLNGGCDQVKRIVKQLTEHGNDQVYGIIDWDKKNTASGKILILGNDQRYSIENYILDPLYMGLFLMHQNIKSTIDFNISSIKSIYDLNKLAEEDAQRIIDVVLKDIGFYSENKREYITLNGFKLRISNDFCIENGHALEEKYKEKYQRLKQYNKENILKNMILDLVICPQPNYIPNEVIETFRLLK